MGAALCLPLVMVSVREHAAVAWIARPGLTALRILFHDYFGATPVAAVLLLVCAVAAVLPPAWLVAAGGGPGASSRRRRGDRARRGDGGSLVAQRRGQPALRGGAVARAPGRAAHRRVPGRTRRCTSTGTSCTARRGRPCWPAPGWSGSGGGCAGAAGRPSFFWALGAVVCACALVLQLGPQQRVRTPQSRAYDFGGPSRYVAAHARPGDGVLFFGTFFRKARLGYPQDFTKTSDFAMARSPQQAGDFRGADKPFRTVEPLMLARQRIWVIGRQPSPHLATGAFRAESAALENNFSLILKRHFRGMVVTLWQRR